MENRPSAAELLAAVADWLAREAAPALSGATGFHARVAGTALAIVERELRAGAGWFDADRAALQTLLGAPAAADRDLLATTARAIREGRFDERLVEVRGVLLALARRKLAIDNPRHLSERDRAQVSVP